MTIAKPDGGNSGKEWSFRTKIFAVIFVVIAALLNWVLKWGIEEGKIILVGGFIAGVFLPVDISKIRQAGHQQGVGQ